MDDISKFARTLVQKICPETDKLADPEERDLFYTLKDTFNGFGREYVKSWKFLNQSGLKDFIKRAFDAVHVDRCGLLE